MTEGILLPGTKQPEMSGYIHKWVNYLRGWQKRYVILQDGTLYYYKNIEDIGSNCRGSLPMKDVIITAVGNNNILLTKHNNETVHFKWQDLKERTQWMAALNAARKRLENVVLPNEDEDEEDIAQEKVTALISEFTQRVEELKKSLDHVVKQYNLVESAMGQVSMNDKELTEKVNLFRVASSDHVNKSREIVDFANSLSTKYLAFLQQEKNQKEDINSVLEVLAQQNNILAKACKQARRHSIETTKSDEEFYDAYEQQQLPPELETGEDDSVSVTTLGEDAQPREPYSVFKSSPPAIQVKPPSTPAVGIMYDNDSMKSSASRSTSDNSDTEEDTSVLFNQKTDERRMTIKDRPEVVMSLWSIIKNCLGKDLSKIPMPVNFNEPISMLQRLAEDFEYYDILDKAAQASDDFEQMALVSAFTVSSYSTTAKRTNKPFNPLLFETFEMDRMNDLGFRLISEQVSHHPPIIAQFVEGRNWKCWQEFSMATKFKGSYLQINPLGVTHLEFSNKNHYTWRKVATTVNNLILGSLWIDQAGQMKIENHTKNIVADIKFEPYRLMSTKQQRSILGTVSQKGTSEAHWQISGHWDDHVDICRATTLYPEERVENDDKWGKLSRVWTVNQPLPRSEKWYNLSKFAVQLNEPDDSVAPTDSRRRPDQRLMEDGDFEGANREKLRLEEKQRTARRTKEAEALQLRSKNQAAPSHQPIWFEQKLDETSSIEIYTYNHKYWKAKKRQEWSQCPDIF